MAEFVRATISEIHVGDRLRPIDLDYAEGIAASMSEHGQISPIMIRRTPAKKGTPYTLVAGGYRTTAANLLGWTEIDAIIVKADGVEAQLLEISENLYRNELNPLDRAIFVLKYRELWEEKHGEIKRGRPSDKNRNDYGIIFTGGRELSDRVKERFGFGQSTYEKVTSIGKNLDPVLKQAVRGTSAENDQSQLLKLAKLSREDQIKVAATLAVQPDVKMALAFTKPPALVTQPSQSTILTKLIAAWDEASEETRDSFLEHIGMSGMPDALSPPRFVHAIGSKLQRVGEGTILIIDEAQNAVPDAINQLRHFVDMYGCGVALIGNEDTATAFVKDQGRSVASRAQVTSRFDKLLRRERDLVGDAKLLISAWGVTDPDCERFLLGLATKPGHLRLIDRTMKAASMAALFNGEDGVTAAHLQAAWKSRNMEDAR